MTNGPSSHLLLIDPYSTLHNRVLIPLFRPFPMFDCYMVLVRFTVWKQIKSIINWPRDVKTLFLKCLFVSHKDNLQDTIKSSKLLKE
jgi:hypothetical protein